MFLYLEWNDSTRAQLKETAGENRKWQQTLIDVEIKKLCKLFLNSLDGIK